MTKLSDGDEFGGECFFEIIVVVLIQDALDGDGRAVAGKSGAVDAAEASCSEEFVVAECSGRDVQLCVAEYFRTGRVGYLSGVGFPLNVLEARRVLMMDGFAAAEACEQVVPEFRILTIFVVCTEMGCERHGWLKDTHS